jgi:hypothetical protein
VSECRSLGPLLLRVRHFSASRRCSTLTFLLVYSECQKSDRKLGKHKETCGKRLSDVNAVPVLSSSELAASSSTVNRDLRRQLDALARNTNTIGHIFDTDQTLHTTFACADSSGKVPEGAEEIKAHHLANRKLAVEHKDSLAIGLIALTATEGFKATDLELKWNGGAVRGGPSRTSEVARDGQEPAATRVRALGGRTRGGHRTRHEGDARVGEGGS